MTWRYVRAFAQGGLPVGVDDVSRVVQSPRGTAVVIADASSAPFEVVAPALSRAMLDAAIAAWSAGAAPSFAIEEARCIVADAGEDASGSMLFAHLGETTTIAWVGLHEAWHVDAGTIVARTAPHSLRAIHGANAPDVPTRTLSHVAVSADIVTWYPTVGTRIAIVGTSVARTDAPILAGELSVVDDLVHAAAQARPDRIALAVLAERIA
jgi:hypothetical protein